MCVQIKTNGKIRNIGTLPNFGGFARIELPEEWQKVSRAGGIPVEEVAQHDRNMKTHWYPVRCNENTRLYIVCIGVEKVTKVVTKWASPPLSRLHKSMPLIGKEKDILTLRKLKGRGTLIKSVINRIKEYQNEIIFVTEQLQLPI